MACNKITRPDIALLCDCLDADVEILDDRPTLQARVRKAAALLRAIMAIGVPVSTITIDLPGPPADLPGPPAPWSPWTP